MKTGLALLVLAVVARLLYRRCWYASDDRPVSARWLITNDRREWSAGIDQSRIATWPIPRDPAADISHDPYH